MRSLRGTADLECRKRYQFAGAEGKRTYCLSSSRDEAVRWLYNHSFRRRYTTGATRDGIVEALSVAVAVNAGAALIFSSRVMDAFNALSAV